MFVDCTRAQRIGSGRAVATPFERGVRWYEANGFVSEQRIKTYDASGGV